MVGRGMEGGRNGKREGIRYRGTERGRTCWREGKKTVGRKKRK